ncbi:cobalamin (vitamin B12) biosynthesis CbiG protein [Sulfobacillus acidophilus TPY]|nr:cobalamin (vitamin B12) biosynthesis CbiG protein [Sulfobacillus acidophilus TPY]
MAITKHGVDIARQIQIGYPLVDVYYPAKLARGDEEALGIQVYQGSVVQQIPRLFPAYQGLIGIVSLGAMVRLIAPWIKDKRTDPAVVVIDDRARHVISVLSGHLGGANQLARDIARVLHATPVITTASDVGETVAVDLLGREFGWVIENENLITAVSAAVVNEERILVIQEAGERDWWPEDKPLPATIQVVDSCDAATDMPFDAALVITPRILTAEETARFLDRGVLYRPKVIVVGIGCNRGTSAEEIDRAIHHVLAEAHLSPLSVRNLATIDLKADEPGIRQVAARYGWPVVTYSAEELNRGPILHPSETVFRYVGAYGVSEPAARLSSGASEWVVEKVKHGNVTVSVCLVPPDRRPASEKSGRVHP